MKSIRSAAGMANQPLVPTAHSLSRLGSRAIGAAAAQRQRAAALAVMPEQVDSMERAIKNLGWRRRIQIEDRFVVIACLLRQDDWRPLEADWWRGKEVCIIGADLGGNFFLRHCDGTVRLWDHKTQTDVIIAPSVRDFVSRIIE